MILKEIAEFIRVNNALGGPALTVKEVTAILYLVTNLKLNGLWPTSGVMYLEIGSSAITHSINFLNPGVNTITWTNDTSSNHAATGWTTASNGSGSTGLAINALSANNLMYCCYLRSRPQTGQGDMGNNIAEAGNVTLITSWADGAWYWDVGNSSSGRLSGTSLGAATGLHVAGWSGNTQFYAKNGAVIDSRSFTSASLNANPVLVGTRDGSAGTQGEYAFFQAGPCVPVAQLAIHNTIIQNFQTILGRKV